MSLTAALLGLTACGAAGAAVPALIRAIPEPVPEPSPEALPEPVDPSVASAPLAVTSAGGTVPASEAGTVAPGSGLVPASTTGVGTEDSERAQVAPAKVPYPELGARAGLGVRAVLLSGLGGALVAWSQGWSWNLLVLLPLVPVLVALSVVDWNTRLLPTWVIRPTYYLTVALVLLAAVASWDGGAVLRAGLGWLALGAFYVVLWFVNSAGLGYGDVRLSGILGLAGGYVGWAELLTGAWCAFVLGGVLGGLLALFKVVDRKGVPFGPFMVLGALVGLLVGPAVGSSVG